VKLEKHTRVQAIFVQQAALPALPAACWKVALYSSRNPDLLGAFCRFFQV